MPFQMFNTNSVSPVLGLSCNQMSTASGLLAASPLTTPRNTPRSTPTHLQFHHVIQQHNCGSNNGGAGLVSHKTPLTTQTAASHINLAGSHKCHQQLQLPQSLHVEENSSDLSNIMRSLIPSSVINIGECKTF